MNAEATEAGEQVQASFEQSLFLHDRDLWKITYDPDIEDVEDDLEYVSPSADPAEFADVMADLRQRGFLND